MSDPAHPGENMVLSRSEAPVGVFACFLHGMKSQMLWVCLAGTDCEEGHGRAAMPGTGSTFHSPPVSQGHKIPAWCPQTSHTQFPPESQVVSRQERGRKRDLLSVFCRCPGDGKCGGDPSHTQTVPMAGRSVSCFIVGFHTAEQAGNQAGPDQNVPEQNCWHSLPCEKAVFLEDWSYYGVQLLSVGWDC